MPHKYNASCKPIRLSDTGIFTKLQHTVYTTLNDVLKQRHDINIGYKLSSAKCHTQSAAHLSQFVLSELQILLGQPTATDLFKRSLTMGYMTFLSMSVIYNPLSTTNIQDKNGMLLVSQGYLSLLSHMYSSAKYIPVYTQYLTELFHRIFGDTHPFSATDIVHLERWISSKYLKNEDITDTEVMPINMTDKEIGIRIGHIIGSNKDVAIYNKTGIRDIITRIKKECIQKNISTKSKWHSLWAYHIILAYSWSVYDIAKYIFDFNNSIYKPHTTPTLNVHYFINLMPISSSQLYLERMQNPSAVHFCLQLCHLYVDLFSKNIANNRWLCSNTKKILMHKVKNVRFVIGPSDVPTFDIDLHTPIRHFIPSLVNQYIRIHTHMISQIGTTYTLNIAPYTVNALFNHASNTIHIPYSILTAPLLNIHGCMWHNIATLGFMIGHELCHCVDTTGMRYGHTGKYYAERLIKPNEFKAYQEKADKITRYINRQIRMEQHTVYHGEFTNEIVADISGFLLTEHILCMYFTSTHMDIPKGLTDFYKLYARLWNWDTPTEVDTIYKNDAHTPDKYRVNGVLLSSKYFRKMHNIPEPPYDDIWVHPIS